MSAVKEVLVKEREKFRYSMEFLLKIRHELHRNKSKRSVLSAPSAPSGKEKPLEDRISETLAHQAPGHIFRDHKTLHTASIVRKKLPETPQKAEQRSFFAGTPVEKSLSFVSDFERSEVMKMREKVRLALNAHKSRQAKDTSAPPSTVEPVKQQVRRKEKVEPCSEGSFQGMDFDKFYKDYTVGGNKAHARAALKVLQDRYGPNWHELLCFQPYYYPVIVPVPYAEKKAQHVPADKSQSPTWSFGKSQIETPIEQDLSLPGTNEEDHLTKMNKVIERLQLPIQIGSHSKNHHTKPDQGQNTLNHCDAERDDFRVQSCFQVPAAKHIPNAHRDPRISQKLERKDAKHKKQVPSNKSPKSLTRSGDKSVNSDHKSKSPSKNIEVVKKPDDQEKSSTPSPFSSRKRVIMPIMRSKKFVIWLHVTNHPEPPYEHSYLKPLTPEQASSLREIVLAIPNRPDPIDPSITDEEYFVKVEDWKETLEKITPFVAPKPDAAETTDMK